MQVAQLDEELLEPNANEKRLPIDLPEIRVMRGIISSIGWVNLLIGLPSVILMFTLKSPSLVATGLLSILTCWLLRMMARHISKSESWTEIGVIAMCGIYFPMCVLWICTSNLIDAILH